MRRRTHTQRLPASVAVAAVLGLLVTGCPADDDPDEDTVAYCAQSEELDDQDEPPTDAQLASLAAAAPEDIADDAQLLADRHAEVGADAFDEPEVVDAVERLEAWEADHCP